MSRLEIYVHFGSFGNALQRHYSGNTGKYLCLRCNAARSTFDWWLRGDCVVTAWHSIESLVDLQRAFSDNEWRNDITYASCHNATIIQHDVLHHKATVYICSLGFFKLDWRRVLSLHSAIRCGQKEHPSMADNWLQKNCNLIPFFGSFFLPRLSPTFFLVILIPCVGSVRIVIMCPAIGPLPHKYYSVAYL